MYREALEWLPTIWQNPIRVPILTLCVSFSGNDEGSPLSRSKSDSLQGSSSAQPALQGSSGCVITCMFPFYGFP